jgi:ribosomal protein L32
VSVCQSCGHRNQPGAKFCSECGLVLAGTRPPSYEERKVVTVLFADLVGFTSRAEQILGRRDEARRWLSTWRDSSWSAAAQKLTDQEFAAAAEVLDSMGAEADDQLRRALSFFRSVDATRFIREAEAVLAAST